MQFPVDDLVRNYVKNSFELVPKFDIRTIYVFLCSQYKISGKTYSYNKHCIYLIYDQNGICYLPNTKFYHVQLKTKLEFYYKYNFIIPSISVFRNLSTTKQHFHKLRSPLCAIPFTAEWIFCKQYVYALVDPLIRKSLPKRATQNWKASYLLAISA